MEYPAPGCLNDVPKGGCKGEHTPLQLKKAAFASQNIELKSIPFTSMVSVPASKSSFKEQHSCGYCGKTEIKNKDNNAQNDSKTQAFKYLYIRSLSDLISVFPRPRGYDKYTFKKNCGKHIK